MNISNATLHLQFIFSKYFPLSADTELRPRVVGGAIGEGGLCRQHGRQVVSGGQQQRVAIAAALSRHDLLDQQYRRRHKAIFENKHDD